MENRVLPSETHRLLVELKEHLYGNEWGKTGDILFLKEQLKTLNEVATTYTEEVKALPCKKNMILGCVPRKIFFKWLFIIILILSGGTIGLDKALEMILTLAAKGGT